jgi:hypothetical protein
MSPGDVRGGYIIDDGDGGLALGDEVEDSATFLAIEDLPVEMDFKRRRLRRPMELEQ